MGAWVGCGLAIVGIAGDYGVGGGSVAGGTPGAGRGGGGELCGRVDGCGGVAATGVAQVAVPVGGHSVRLFDTRGVGLAVHGCWIDAAAHIVGMVIVGVVSMVGVDPARLVDVKVVGVEKSRSV